MKDFPDPPPRKSERRLRDQGKPNLRRVRTEAFLHGAVSKLRAIEVARKTFLRLSQNFCVFSDATRLPYGAPPKTFRIAPPVGSSDVRFRRTPAVFFHRVVQNAQFFIKGSRTLKKEGVAEFLHELSTGFPTRPVNKCPSPRFSTDPQKTSKNPYFCPEMTPTP